MTNPPLHIAIIGGGAAGYFAAIEAKRNYPSADITIFEKNQKMLAKVEITGGGRCNLTNSFQGNRRHGPWGMSWEAHWGIRNCRLHRLGIILFSI